MPKRFTATEKWQKEWFQKLSPVEKCVWQYLCDTCDQAGVWEPNYSMASFLVGAEVSEKTLERLGDRVERLKCGKYWIKKFVAFQCGEELSNNCKAHQPIIRILQKHGLLDRVSIGLSNPFHTLQEEEEEKESSSLFPEEGSGEKPKRVKVSDVVAAWNATTLPKVQEVSSDRLAHARARLREPYFTRHYAEAIRKIGDSNFCLGDGPNGWVATFDWLVRPGTVAKVMEGKYDNKKTNANGHQTHRPNPRNDGLGGDSTARSSAVAAAVARRKMDR